MHLQELPQYVAIDIQEALEERFMESEAGHYTLFIELAETYIDKEKVRRRWSQWLEYEAVIMKNLTVRGDRIH